MVMMKDSTLTGRRPKKKLDGISVVDDAKNYIRSVSRPVPMDIS